MTFPQGAAVTPDGEGAVPRIFSDVGDVLECPVTLRPMHLIGDQFVVPGTDRRYEVVDGIPRCFVNGNDDRSAPDVTTTVKEFYELTPFPNYDGLDSRESLAARARKSVFAAMLDSQIPEGALVLEAGCGTGQMTNFLGMSWKRKVLGGDMSFGSLRLAKAFRDRYGIRNAAFLQMNIFHLPFRDSSFDVIVSNGVLHHTGDAAGGFAALVRKLKPGGFIAVGLYNAYARLPTLWRRTMFERFGESLHFLDPRLRRADANEARVRAWFMDQYRHPHETRHSMDEVLGWFAAHAIDFTYGIPAPDNSPFTANDKLFEVRSPGIRMERVMTQVEMLLKGGKDGGLFVMIGRKRQ
jgi:SAM-dependent methyltransferase